MIKSKLKSLLVVSVVAFALLLSGAYAQTSTITMDVVDRNPTPELVKVTKEQTQLVPFKDTYVFGTIGSTTNGKSSTVTSVGVGKDVFKLMDGKVTLGVEGAVTHFTGKRLNTINNDQTAGFAVVDKKNLLELGGKVSYQFNEQDPLNIRLFGKAGVATTTLKNANQLSPYFGGGVEFAVRDSDLVWVLEAKQYTNLRKAKVYYNENLGSKFNTRKDNTVLSLGVQYRF